MSILILSGFLFFQCILNTISSEEETQYYPNCYENTLLEIANNDNIFLQVKHFCVTFSLSVDMCSFLHEKMASLFTINGIHIPIQMVSLSNETTFSASIDWPIYLDGKHISPYEILDQTGRSLRQEGNYCATANDEIKYFVIGAAENVTEKANLFCTVHSLSTDHCIALQQRIIHEISNEAESVHDTFRSYSIPMQFTHSVNIPIHLESYGDEKWVEVAVDAYSNTSQIIDEVCTKHDLDTESCAAAALQITTLKFPQCSKFRPSRKYNMKHKMTSLFLSLEDWKVRHEEKLEEWCVGASVTSTSCSLIKAQMLAISSSEGFRIPIRLFTNHSVCYDHYERPRLEETPALKDAGFTRYASDILDRYLLHNRGMPWNLRFPENQSWNEYEKDRILFWQSRLQIVQRFHQEYQVTKPKLFTSEGFGTSAISTATRGSLVVTSPHKLMHDEEQLQYLITNGCIPSEFQKYIAQLTSVRLSLGESNDTVIMSADSYSTLGSVYNTNIYLPLGPPPGSIPNAVNPNLDFQSITDTYFGHEFGVAVIDDFLTVDTLHALIAYCNEATIFHDVKPGYLGAYFYEGLNIDLFSQIEDELRLHMPDIFADYPLTNLWAYKYDGDLGGIRVHADNAAVNLNFWITPESANLDPNTGGLMVYNISAPLDENVRSWNVEDEGVHKNIAAFLGNATALNVPYRQNRAVLFNSNLLHATAPLSFKRGYTNRRVNLTMLFGKRMPHIKRTKKKEVI